MKSSSLRALSVFICALFLTAPTRAQGECVITINLANHHRFAYKTEEECQSGIHTVPWGNWGVSSNVGSKRNADQFKGWDGNCANVKVQWNSCSASDRFRLSSYLNFPQTDSDFPLPNNGYPFSDSYFWNDTVPPFGTALRVDQYSPCGPGVYGGATLRIPVPALTDTNGDGTGDLGGCLALNGKLLTVQRNFMTVYELDEPDADDLIETLYYPDLQVRLSCTPYNCFATDDLNSDGTPDDLTDPRSAAWQWPVKYQDNDGAICQPTDPGVPCKRIDATIRIGFLYGAYLGPLAVARQRINSTAPSVVTGRRLLGRLVEMLMPAPLNFISLPERHFRPAVITGRVSERETGQPLAAEIGLLEQNEAGLTLKHINVSEQGWFALDDLAAGSFHLSTKLDGFASEHYSLALSNGEQRHIELPLTRARIVRGVTLDPVGAPLADALIRVIHMRAEADGALSADWQWETGEVRSDETGRFMIAVHPQIEFVIAASHSSFPAAISAPLRADADEPFVRLSFERRNHSLRNK
jgi:hypothetical protein